MNSRSKINLKSGGLIGIVVILYGLQALYFDLKAHYFYQPVEARVLQSSVQLAKGGLGRSYFPSVTFEYSVGGRTFTSDKFHIRTIGSAGKRGKERLIERYHVGSIHTAYVDVNNPQLAVLDRSIGLMGPICVLLGLFLSYIWRRYGVR